MSARPHAAAATAAPVAATAAATAAPVAATAAATAAPVAAPAATAAPVVAAAATAAPVAAATAGTAAPSSVSLDDCIGGTAFNVRKTVEYPVGSGGYSHVYKAQLTRGGVTHPVALKVILRTDSPERLRKREERERIWIKLNHQNIAPLNAIYRQTDGLLVFVSPWYENGTADIYLRNNPVVNPMGIVCEISSAIEHLHGEGIVHGDLKGSNIMIDDSGHVKLIDFGLSRYTESHTELTTSTHTTLRWCAPELLDSEDPRPTKPSDVYSFASTILELLTGQFPYNKFEDVWLSMLGFS